MKKVTVLALVMCLSVFSIAQKVYFVYFQHESQEPFFVRMHDKIYSSSASGWLILSKLRDSSYKVNIGFPGGQSPDQQFSFTINRKDQGYLLKNFSEKGWGLFNMQTMAVQMASENRMNDVVKTEKRESNSFTDLLSKAADDSTIKDKPIIVKTDEKKPAEITPPEQKKEDSVILTEPKTEVVVPEKKEEIILQEKKEEPVTVKQEPVLKDTAQTGTVIITENKLPEEGYKKSTVIRRSESSTTEGFGLVFIDVYPGGETDTIRIIIPNEARSSVPNTIGQEKQEEKKFLEILPDTVQNKSIPAEIRDTVIQSAGKNNCKSVAQVEDLIALRKTMSSESNDDNMVAEARKAFKIRCYTTMQLKNLSTLFPGDEGKYKFFDAAYTYVADPENFVSLQSELKEDYYINRFKAMLR